MPARRPSRPSHPSPWPRSWRPSPPRPRRSRACRAARDPHAARPTRRRSRRRRAGDGPLTRTYVRTRSDVESAHASRVAQLGGRPVLHPGRFRAPGLGRRGGSGGHGRGRGRPGRAGRGRGPLVHPGRAHRRHAAVARPDGPRARHGPFVGPRARSGGDHARRTQRRAAGATAWRSRTSATSTCSRSPAPPPRARTAPARGCRNLSAALHSIELVLADGSTLEVNEESDADAWRAARVSVGRPWSGHGGHPAGRSRFHARGPRRRPPARRGAGGDRRARRRGRALRVLHLPLQRPGARRARTAAWTARPGRAARGWPTWRTR